MSTTDHLFWSREPLALAGSCCATCRTTTFPVQADCPRCATVSMAPVELPRSGTLWTWTAQTFAPRAPYTPATEGFTPFVVGYVDLGTVLVESILEVGADTPTVGMSLDLVPSLWRTASGDDVPGYSFSPAAEDPR